MAEFTNSAITTWRMFCVACATGSNWQTIPWATSARSIGEIKKVEQLLP